MSSCSQTDLKAALSTLISPIFGSRRKNKLPSTVSNLISPKSILFRLSSAQAVSLRYFCLNPGAKGQIEKKWGVRCRKSYQQS